MLEAVKNGQQRAIDAVRKFVDTVDQSLPLGGEDPSKRQEVIDSALDMADNLVATQCDFLRTVVQPREVRCVQVAARRAERRGGHGLPGAAHQRGRVGRACAVRSARDN